MSTTVSYKGDTLTTVSNATKVLGTGGTWMEGDLTLTDSTTKVVETSVTIPTVSTSISFSVEHEPTAVWLFLTLSENHIASSVGTYVYGYYDGTNCKLGYVYGLTSSSGTALWSIVSGQNVNYAYENGEVTFSSSYLGFPKGKTYKVVYTYDP